MKRELILSDLKTLQAKGVCRLLHRGGSVFHLIKIEKDSFGGHFSDGKYKVFRAEDVTAFTLTRESPSIQVILKVQADGQVVAVDANGSRINLSKLKGLHAALDIPSIGGELYV